MERYEREWINNVLARIDAKHGNSSQRFEIGSLDQAREAIKERAPRTAAALSSRIHGSRDVEADFAWARFILSEDFGT